MSALALQLTNAGLAAVTASSGTEKTVIAELGLTETPFLAAPSLTALPGEFKRLEILSGIAAAPNIAHITAYDTSDAVWQATGFGLFLEDGTLFATYSADEPVLSKAGLAFALMAFDIAFNADLLADITFGDATFVWPPATEQARGVARIATQDEVDDGESNDVIVTPKTLGDRLILFLDTVGESLSGFVRNTVKVTGGGLATGGGPLDSDRVITVSEATPAEIGAGTAADKVVTPRRLGVVSIKLESNGYVRFFGLQMCWGRWTSAGVAGDPVIVPFERAFSGEPFSIVLTPVVVTGAAATAWTSDGITGDNFPARCSVAGIGCRYIAIGAPS